MPWKANIFTHFLDDDIDVVEWFDWIMETIGVSKDRYEITQDPEEFKSKLKRSDINLFVVDHYFGGKGIGVEIVKEIKEINPDSYVIVLTGQSDYKVVGRYIRVGADDYVDKNEPEYKDDLIAAILRGFKLSNDRIEKAKEYKEIRKTLTASAEMARELLEQLK